MRAVARGDNAAMREVLRRFTGMVYRIGSERRVKDPEDFAQDVWLRLSRGAGRYDAAKGSVSTFIAVIAHRLAIDSHRRGALRRTASYGDGCPERGVRDPEPVEPASIVSLSPPLRAVLEETYLRGLTLRQHARTQRIPIGTAKSRLNRALRLARQGALGASEGLSPFRTDGAPSRSPR